MDKELKPEDYDVQSFVEKIMLYKPRFVCFNGKTAASIVLHIQNTKELDYGLQNRKIGNTQIFIAPSTSPRAYAFWDESQWTLLKTLINQQ
jgi:TDG/mug DNA glycosylase family protein